MFEPFPKMQRFSHGWTVTEKLDGTNAAIVVARPEDFDTPYPLWIDPATGLGLWAQSRTKLITPGKTTDNYGFAQFVHDNAQDLIEALGEGRHFGEWFGNGIQRNYGMARKEFALFNVHRWAGVDLPDRVRTVPVIIDNQYLDEPGSAFNQVLNDLKLDGSSAAPGFLNAEGIVIRHNPSGTMFKKTFDYDELGKWAENQTRKQETAK